MSNEILTIIFSYRNRDPERVARCMASLEGQTRRDFVVLFVDYGSTPECAEAVKRIIQQHQFATYIYAETRGWVWNRSHALNIGIRIARTPIVMTSDVDIIFPSDFIDHIMQQQDGNSIIHSAVKLLPEKFSAWGDIDSYADRRLPELVGHRGLCQCVPLNAALSVHGFDQQFRMWGMEDVDFAERLQRIGVKEIWIQNNTCLYHQWHPEGGERKSALEWNMAWARMGVYYENSRHKLLKNTEDWGHCVSETDRPAYRIVERDHHLIDTLSGARIFKYDPGDPTAVFGLMRQFNESSPGEAIAVDGVKFPRTSSAKDMVKRLANRCFEFGRLSIRLEYPVNYLHMFLQDLIFYHNERVSDYYIGCGQDSQFTLIMKK